MSLLFCFSCKKPIDSDLDKYGELIDEKRKGIYYCVDCVKKGKFICPTCLGEDTEEIK